MKKTGKRRFFPNIWQWLKKMLGFFYSTTQRKTIQNTLSNPSAFSQTPPREVLEISSIDPTRCSATFNQRENETTLKQLEDEFVILVDMCDDNLPPV